MTRPTGLCGLTPPRGHKRIAAPVGSLATLRPFDPRPTGGYNTGDAIFVPATDETAVSIGESKSIMKTHTRLESAVVYRSHYQPCRSGMVRIARLFFLTAALHFVHTANAAIIGGTARVDTLVQELIDGTPASITSDSGEADLLSTNPSASALPVSATAELTSTDLEGELVSQGRGLARLSDPTRLHQDNPEEFRLEAACYSNADNVSYIVNAVATQQRDLVFTTSGNPLAEVEIEFNNNGTRNIESLVFLSGAVLIWSTGSPATLADLQGEIQINITRGDAEPLFATSLTISADEAGTISTETTGPITFTTLSLADLSDTGLLDTGTFDALSQIDQGGVLMVLAIEAQSHTYTYPVTADATFTLTATMEITLRAPPGGVGIAATLGGPFENLTGFVDDGLPDVSGESVGRAINSSAGLDTHTGSNAGTGLGDGSRAAAPAPSSFVCGAFGLESLLVMMVSLVAPVSLWRRRNNQDHPYA